jgi:hypothetical protein
MRWAPDRGTRIEGAKNNMLSDVSCQKFELGLGFGAARMPHADRIAIFAQDVTGATCYEFKPMDELSFVGDMDFTKQNCAPNRGVTMVSADTSNTAYGY